MIKNLIVCAHLDDESFGLGGTLIKLTKTKPKNTKIVILCKGRCESDSITRLKAFNYLITKLNCQSKVYQFNDLTLDKHNFIDIVAVIQNEVDSFKPDIVYSTCENDLHRDHQIIAEATKLACRPQSACSVKEYYQFKIPAASSWGFNSTNFNVAFDITENIETKLDLCSKYLTELKAESSCSPLSLKGLKHTNAADGSIFGYEYAELAQLIFKR